MPDDARLDSICICFTAHAVFCAITHPLDTVRENASEAITAACPTFCKAELLILVSVRALFSLDSMNASRAFLAL